MEHIAVAQQADHGHGPHHVHRIQRRQLRGPGVEDIPHQQGNTHLKAPHKQQAHGKFINTTVRSASTKYRSDAAHPLSKGLGTLARSLHLRQAPVQCPKHRAPKARALGLSTEG